MSKGECGEEHRLGKKEESGTLEDFLCQSEKGVGGFAL